MTKDELIERLRSDLEAMEGWARELGDEYLDGDPEVRQQYVADLKSVRESRSLKADE